MNLMKSLAALLLVFGLLALPWGVGLVTLTSAAPSTPEWVRVAPKSLLAAGGEPQRFTVFMTGRDGWTAKAAQPVGLVYLRQTATGEVLALNATSPRMGAPIRYDKARRRFHDDCLADGFGNFDLDGKRVGENISPADLDQFETLVERGEVWIRWPDKS